MRSRRASTTRPSPSPSGSRGCSSCRSRTSSVRANPMGEGEQLHAQRRRRFWVILGWLLVIGLLAGFLSGFAAGFIDASQGEGHPAMMIVGAIGVVLLCLGGVYGSWRFFTSVDEVEVADNLWASLIGLYAYAILFPAWWLLESIRLVGPPAQGGIYAATMLTATAAYLYRKWQSR